MRTIVINDKGFEKLTTPEFQKFAKEKNLELVGPLEGSKPDNYIYKVSRCGCPPSDILAHFEAEVDLMAFISFKVKVPVVYTLEFNIEQDIDEGDVKHFQELADSYNTGLNGFQVTPGKFGGYDISLEILTKVEIELPTNLAKYKPIELRQIDIYRPELGARIVID